MIDAPSWQVPLSWLLTYLAHGTLLLSSAWLLTRVVGAERLRLRERIWRTALFGALLTSTAQVALDVAPLAGRLDLGSPAELAEAGTVAEPAVLTAAVVPDGHGPLAERLFDWHRLVLGLWIAGGLLGVTFLLLAWRRIADFLAGRRPLSRGFAFETLARLAGEAGLRRPPRLCASHRLRSPATIGVFAPQICLPWRALTELTPEQLEALLAHELAHVVRRDPLWLFAARLVERALFFQPLNRVAARELDELAEFLADDWAAQRTRRELDLARCLTEVATWVLDRRPVVALVPMASRNSRLAARITRLLDEERRPQDHRRRRSASIATGVVLAAGLLALPGAAALVPAEGPCEASGPAAPPRPERPATGSGLTELLRILDHEVEALGSEVAALSAELTPTITDPSSRQASSLRDLRARLADLRARRQRLHQLIPALQVERPAATGTEDEPRSGNR